MYVCSICEGGFASVDELCYHLTFYHHCLFRGSYFCVFCSRSVKRLDTYKKHLLNGHYDHDAEYIRYRGENVVNAGNGDALQEDVGDAYNALHQENNDVGVEVVVGEGEEEDIYSLEHFVNSLYSGIEMFVGQLYAIPNMNRKCVDNIVVGTSELISNFSNTLKKNVFKFLSTFENVPNNFAEEINKLDNMFSVLLDPFESMKSEHLRFKSLSDRGVFIAPEPFEMGHEEIYQKGADGILRLVQNPVYGQFIPLGRVLKSFLQLPGVFAGIVNYLQELNIHDGLIRNVVQGKQWKEVKALYERETKMVLPLNLEFDDYEPDNVLGSHNSAHSLGALYAIISCLPPVYQSQLENMFLFTIFESKYRKQFGNRMAFSPAIAELKLLAQEGILINVDDRHIRVYFCLCVLMGDNLGMNSIQGFVEGFTANFFCRICKLHRNEMRVHSLPIEANRLRTIENYNEDVAIHDQSQTGISEECVWNEVPYYHCISNSYCDVMHDVFEGIVKYDLCHILYYCIHVRGYFTLDILCNRIDAFDYGPSDVGNKPPTSHFTLARLETCSINLSSTEWLCLVRYLGLMIGDLVPEGNGVWKLYLCLREFLELIGSPIMYEGVPAYIQILVQEHHQLYLRYFGMLKPKHHFILHYAELLGKLGPLIHLTVLMCERAHRKGKMYARVSNSRVNLALSVAIKFQLYLSARLMRSENFVSSLLTSRVSRVCVNTLHDFEELTELLAVDPISFISVAECVETNGSVYSLGMILVLKVGDLLPQFGKIANIVVKEKNVIFICNILKTVLYRQHICSYEVEPTDDYVCLPQNSLKFFIPLWERTYENIKVVCLKHSL